MAYDAVALRIRTVQHLLAGFRVAGEAQLLRWSDEVDDSCAFASVTTWQVVHPIDMAECTCLPFRFVRMALNTLGRIGCLAQEHRMLGSLHTHAQQDNAQKIAYREAGPPP